MPINIPVPIDVDKHRPLSQLFADILRRAIDGSVNPVSLNVGIRVVGNDITIVTPGNGLVLSNRNGTHTYRLLVDNDGALALDQIT